MALEQYGGDRSPAQHFRMHCSLHSDQLRLARPPLGELAAQVREIQIAEPADVKNLGPASSTLALGTLLDRRTLPDNQVGLGNWHFCHYLAPLLQVQRSSIPKCKGRLQAGPDQQSGSRRQKERLCRLARQYTSPEEAADLY